ncbi:hypothetical protein TVAG_136780 [Trichomonas vaginalis G3]|uniref:Uncharacterized protein n=1 Tax=Trichomonas vaginalis (strain ATCC PRA-98 / G3) TaxID=412133 RepID=A2DJG0_TRIV3|nr:hypothetical protein TVAG_136780 [Trichomonas vaginalis G3]|eukprot:XP_001580533.1 hypothetical protein [Trichomonas vaginalis G3]
MAAGFFKKIWNGIKKGATWAWNKVIKPVANAVKDFLPAIGTAICAKFGGGQGAQIGGTAGEIAKGLIGGKRR